MIDVVPCPDTIVAPAGTVQVYVVAPETAAIEYVFDVEASQIAAVPDIAPGVAGAALVNVTGKVAAVDVPHEFVAVTVTFPDVEPNETVALVDPCPDVIVAPAGTVHV